MIKLPSVKSLTDHFLQTFIRFKWVILIALAKTITLIWYTEIDYKNEVDRNLSIRLAYVFFLAMPLMLAISLSSERRQWKKYIQLSLIAIAAGLSVLYYFSININPGQTDYYRFMLFIASSHLLISFVPFLGFNERNAFWQFNKTLFLQFLNATLYSATLYIGLLIAIETVKFLFKITFTFKIEGDLFNIIFVFFHTVFFLSKIPVKLADLENETDYPGGLKIFTQYVLLPLEVIYLLILYAYTGKIIFQRQLPEGGVAYLVLAFSTAGILALLLLHPLRESVKERWISLFSHRFYLALIPLIVLLFIGIFRRINDYGVTENRYLVAVLAFWLAGITISFLVSKDNDIRRIPISLSIICVVIAIGPWNLFSVAQNSQLNQFNRILQENKVLNSGNKIGRKATLTNKEYNQLFSIIQFFRDRNSSILKEYFPKLPANLNGEKFNYAMDEYLRKFISKKEKSIENNYTNFSSNLLKEKEFDIKGFSNMLFFNIIEGQPTQNKEWKIVASDKGKILDVYRLNEKIISFDFAKRADEIKSKFGNYSNEVPQDLLSFTHDDEKNHFKIVFRSISRNGSFYNGEGVFLYK